VRDDRPKGILARRRAVKARTTFRRSSDPTTRKKGAAEALPYFLEVASGDLSVSVRASTAAATAIECGIEISAVEAVEHLAVRLLAASPGRLLEVEGLAGLAWVAARRGDAQEAFTRLRTIVSWSKESRLVFPDSAIPALEVLLERDEHYVSVARLLKDWAATVPARDSSVLGDWVRSLDRGEVPQLSPTWTPRKVK
jgi:hypothetical protein